MQSVKSILAITFLVDAGAGASMFVIFRWVADQDPPAESVQLGLISALGSLSYLLACQLVSRLGPKLVGRRMPACGLLIGIVSLVLLTVNRRLWAMYFLWPALISSWALLFPSLTGSVRYGRSGRSLRSALFLFCIAWMSGVTFGVYFGSKLYGVSAGRVGGSYVYLVNIGIHLICLLLLYRPGQRQESAQVAPGPEEAEQVDTGLARVFMGIGWLGNILLMVCMAVLLNLFNKLATDLGVRPEAHGWLVVAIRGSALATAGLMFCSVYWHHRWWSFILAEGLAVAGLCVVGLTGDYWLFVLGFVLVGIMMGHNYYAGVYYSLSSVSAHDAIGHRSRAAINESFFPMGALFGAGLGGLAGWYWVRLPYFLAAGAVLIIFAIQMHMLNKSRSA